jgi:leucyl aminopeptidase
VTAELRLTDRPPAETDADVLVVAIAGADRGDATAPADATADPAADAAAPAAPAATPAAVVDGTPLPPDLAAAVADLAYRVGARGGVDETTRLPAPDGVAASSVLAVGVGRRDVRDLETLRRAAGAAARALAGTGSAVLALPAASPEQAQAVLEGALIGAYAFRTFRSGGTAPLGEVVLAGVDAQALTAAAVRARTVAAAVHRTRDWVNTPPGDLPPAELAAQMETAARSAGLDVRVLDEMTMDAQGYGGILGVGRGSANPPRLVRIAYRPADARAHLAVVGKGITFDTGGLSLKPPEAMTTMKSDMSGAAAAVSTVLAAAELELPVAITVYAPLAENMPSGFATRPSDVLRMYGGTTVEVLNTDAEGRLVMADALARAAEDSPDLVVDIATLTGACVVALGHRVAGLMSDDDATRGLVAQAAGKAGEAVWPLPIPEEMRSKLDSQVADIANIGDRFGGTLQAAAFLREFVPDGLRWAHLDIAGTAFNSEKPHGYTGKGGTGFGVRTLLALAEALPG